MKIKSILCLSFLCVSIIFSSCSQDEDILNSNPLSKTDLPSRSEIQESKDLAMPSYELSLLSEEVKQKRAASIILSDYIVLENNQYKLEISEKDAQKLGIKPYLYESIKNDILSTNEAIQEIMDNGDPIELCDVQAISKAYKKGELNQSDSADKYSRVAYPSGNITTSGQEDGTASFKTEYEHTKVLFRCRTNAAPTPIYRCTVKAWGETKVGSKIGNVITTTEITVPIAASGSGIVAGLTFATSDSNGGYCFWQAQ